jgi:DNA-binding XRE family transcriptional regulator
VTTREGTKITLKRTALKAPGTPNYRLMEARLNRGWSRAALSYNTRGAITRRAIRDIEEGYTRDPHASTKLAIAEALRVKIVDIWPLERRERV